MRYLYLALIVPGSILPWIAAWPYIAGQGPEGTVLELLFANPVSAGFAIDLTITAVAVLAFIAAEGVRQGMRWWPLVFVYACLVGVSGGLPLFLYLRELHRPSAT
jgi:hypothetical protein